MCLEKRKRKTEKKKKAAVDKWRKMCLLEDEGGRPIYRPREWRRRERKLAKEAKRQSWHKSKDHDKVKVSAPLILDPTPDPMAELMKTECAKFEKVHGIRVQVCLKAGQSVKSDAKSEPLRNTGCARENCLPCKSSEGRKLDCEKNSVTYKIICETCLKDGILSTYEGETGRNAFSRGI